MFRSIPIAALAVAVVVLSGCRSDAPETAAVTDVDAFEEATLAWRETRVERLTQPDGWLALVAREWLEAGRHTFGGGEASHYRFEPVGDVIGELELASDRVTLYPVDGHELAFQGGDVAEGMDLTPPQAGASPRITFDQGRGQFEVIRRGDRFALRVMHEASPTLRDFVGLDYFPPDPDWRVQARYEPHEDGRTIQIVNVLGDEEAMVNPGRIHFQREGRSYTLEALEGTNGTLFVVYGDRTNGRDTYGAGRFVYTEVPEGDRVVIDFNRGYNPPCAFSAYTTCPLPPPGNRLDLVIEAGELAYAGPSPAAAYQLP